MPAVKREQILETCSPIFIPTENIHTLYSDIMHKSSTTDNASSYTPSNTSNTHAVAIVQAAHGCLGTCRYCITRFARGPLVSVPIHEICAEITHAVSRGAVEIQLTAQDMSAYGMDLTNRSQLAELLYAIDALSGDFRVRVGMMNPKTLFPVAKEVAKAFTLEKIFSFAHIPVQAQSDAILALMDRGYSISEFLEIIRIFSETVPDILIGTDVIVGYPTETDEDVDALIKLIQAIRPYRLNVTRYSAREGTPAALEYDMPDRFKKDRSRRIITAFQELRKECNAALIGKVFDVHITEKQRSGSVMARTDAYHAVVITDDDEKRDVESGDVLMCGTRTTVTITGERVHYLIGTICDNRG
jgi:MiaB/RimO family radical SAM methylthiotransferase